jgi:hypothetical protein
MRLVHHIPTARLVWFSAGDWGEWSEHQTPAKQNDAEINPGKVNSSMMHGYIMG